MAARSADSRRREVYTDLQVNGGMLWNGCCNAYATNLCHSSLPWRLGYLLATLVLVIVAAQSTQSIQNTTLNDHAQAAVEQLATRAAAELATGNRLGLVAELRFYTDQPLFASPGAGRRGCRAGARGTVGTDQLTFRHAVRIDGDTAGSSSSISISAHKRRPAKP